MRLMWWVLFSIFSYMIIVGFFGIYNYVLETSYTPIVPTYMQSIVSYFKNGSVVYPKQKVVEFPFFEIILITFGSIGFYFTSRFYRKVKRLGFA